MTDAAFDSDNAIVERINRILQLVEAICGPTDDPHLAGTRVAMFCLGTNMALGKNTEELAQAKALVEQVRRVTDCRPEDLANVVALFAIRDRANADDTIEEYRQERVGLSLRVADLLDEQAEERNAHQEVAAELEETRRGYLDALSVIRTLTDKVATLGGVADFRDPANEAGSQDTK